jgi:hypothetical protein
MAQQYIGNCIIFKPGLRSFKMVTIKLMPPKIELPPKSKTLKIHINWPSAGVLRLRGGYAVQPDWEAPPIKKLAISRSPAGGIIQKATALSLGKAMSLAPT